MPCIAAALSKCISITPDQSVAEALDLFNNNRINTIPVVDSSGQYHGMFSFRLILRHLLPKAATMAQGLVNLDFAVGTTPAVAKKLKKVRLLPVRDLLDTDAHVLHPHSSTWEAARLMVSGASPIPIVEPGTRKFIGLISSQSLLEYATKVLGELEAGTYVER